MQSLSPTYADIGADESDALHGTLLPLVREGPLRMGFVPDTQPHEELLARAPAYDKLRCVARVLCTAWPLRSEGLRTIIWHLNRLLLITSPRSL